MRRPILAVLMLLPAASLVAPAAPAASPAMPRGDVVYRPECFGAVFEETLSRNIQPPPPPFSAPPAPSPTPTGGKSMGDDLKENISFESPASDEDEPSPSLDGPRGSKPKTTSSSPKKRESAPASAPEPAKVEKQAPKEAESKPSDRAFEGTIDSIEVADMTGAGERKRAGIEADIEATRRSTLEYGGTLYLSNDDSMSLASAQRLLYATMHDLPFSPREVRPHELLNYFSFDNVAPDQDQLFDVLASAEKQGDRLSVALAVKGAAPPRAPLDLTLVVDRSCSMMDEGRMDYTKRGLTLMSDQLTRGDRLDVVLFDDRVCVPLENYVVGRDDPKLLANVIAMMQPEGATDVSLGLKTAYAVSKSHEDTRGRNRRVMIVTDAMMNTGDVDPNTVSEIGRAFEQDAIRLTGVGVGREFNDQVLDMLTEKGKGAYVFLGSEAVVDRVFGAQGFSSLVQTIAHDVHFALKLPASLAMERFYGEEVSTVKEEVQPVNYYAGTTQLFLQDLSLKEGKVVGTDPVELEITYRDAVTGEPSKRLFRTTVGAMVEADPHNVRKGLALMSWSDMLMAQAMGADPCGSELQTYASRAAKLADDAEIGFVNGLVRRRCGSFELPAFVSNNGVPFKVRVDADIPISTVALDCGGTRSTESLTGGDVIAMFTASPGVCSLTLSGALDMMAKVEVPKTGGDLRCIVRGGRITCG